jgi:hypothetical protein
MVDWDRLGRSQTLAAQAPGGGTVFDAARTYSNFGTGVWAVYRICGSVDFVLTNSPGSTNAVISGVMFGPPPGTPTSTDYLVDTSGGLSQVAADSVGGSLTAYYVRVGNDDAAGQHGRDVGHAVRAQRRAGVRQGADRRERDDHRYSGL